MEILKSRPGWLAGNYPDALKELFLEMDARM